MSSQAIDQFAARLPVSTRDSVSGSGALTTEKRVDILARDFENPDALRRLAGQIKQHTLDHLDQYLGQAVAAMRERGVIVHFASTGEEAKAIILGILQEKGVRRVVKSKTCLLYTSPSPRD